MVCGSRRRDRRSVRGPWQPLQPHRPFMRVAQDGGSASPSPPRSRARPPASVAKASLLAALSSAIRPLRLKPPCARVCRGRRQGRGHRQQPRRARLGGNAPIVDGGPRGGRRGPHDHAPPPASLVHRQTRQTPALGAVQRPGLAVVTGHADAAGADGHLAFDHLAEGALPDLSRFWEGRDDGGDRAEGRLSCQSRYDGVSRSSGWFRVRRAPRPQCRPPAGAPAPPVHRRAAVCPARHSARSARGQRYRRAALRPGAR